MTKKERKPFKREYIPVIVASIILIILIVALVVIFLLPDNKSEIDVPDPNKDIEEVLVDNKNSKCNESELKKLGSVANKLELEYHDLEIVLGQGYDIDTDELDENGMPPLVDITAPVLNVKFKNMTDDIYLKVSSTLNDEVKEYYYKDAKDGVITFETSYSENIGTYTIEVFANKYDCKGDMIRKFELKTPIFNQFSKVLACEEYPDFQYCQKFIKEDEPTYKEFSVALEKYKKEVESGKTTKKTTTKKGSTQNVKDNNEEKNNKGNEVLVENIKNNYVMYIGIALLGIVGVIIVVILVRKRRSRS